MFDHLDIVMAKSMFSADFANKLWTLNFVITSILNGLFSKCFVYFTSIYM